MPKYIVEVIMSTCVAIEVEACNESEARTLAIEEADPFTADGWDYDVDCVCRDYDAEDEDDDEEEE